MQVAKWGNSLAVRLPAAVVEALDLKEGDQVEIQVAGRNAFEVSKAPGSTRTRSPGCASSAAGCPPLSGSTAWRRMSAAETFFDTNVLLYLLSAEQAKAERAEELLAAGGTISVQVLNEFASVALRKLRDVRRRCARGPRHRCGPSAEVSRSPRTRTTARWTSPNATASRSTTRCWLPPRCWQAAPACIRKTCSTASSIDRQLRIVNPFRQLASNAASLSAIRFPLSASLASALARPNTSRNIAVVSRRVLVL